MGSGVYAPHGANVNEGFEKGVSNLADEICIPLVRSNTFVNEEE